MTQHCVTNHNINRVLTMLLRCVHHAPGGAGALVKTLAPQGSDDGNLSDSNPTIIDNCGIHSNSEFCFTM